MIDFTKITQQSIDRNELERFKDLEKENREMRDLLYHIHKRMSCSDVYDDSYLQRRIKKWMPRGIAS